jgi:hypothetical protein
LPAPFRTDVGGWYRKRGLRAGSFVVCDERSAERLGGPGRTATQAGGSLAGNESRLAISTGSTSLFASRRFAILVPPIR